MVLLPPAFDPARRWSDLVVALGRYAPVLAPDLTVSLDRPVILEEPALRVLAAISGSGAESATLCGVGLGALIALTVAAGFGDRVSALVLSVTRTPESTALLSLQHGVRQLLSAGTLQRLGGGPSQVLAALDQVRPVDYRAVAGRVATPTLVLVGERDVANLGPSTRLAAAVPQAQLRVVAKAGAGWQCTQPDRLAELVAGFRA